MLKLGKSWRGMKQCPHSKSESSSQTSQLIHSVLSTRQFFRLCNSKFYTQSAVYSCGASRQSLSCFSIISKISRNLGYTSQFQKKHTPCNLIFFFFTLQDRHASSFNGAPKDSSTSRESQWHLHWISWPGSLSILLPSMPGMLHVTKDSKKAQQQREEEEYVTEKGQKPFDSAPAWVYKACAQSASSAPEPQFPTLALCKGGRSDSSCCHLLAVSVHAHQPCLGRTAPIAARRKRECDSRQREKHFSITCASLHRLHFQLSCLSLKGTYNLLLNDVL